MTTAALHRLYGLFVPFGAAFAIDQASKALILNVVMKTPRTIELTPFFNLTLGFNEGAIFGLMGSIMAGRPLAMAAVTGFITLLLLAWGWRAGSNHERLAAGLIAGGSAGNILDRLRQGAVTDFLDLHWQDWHWPTFNLADVAITLGAAILLSGWILQNRKGRVDA